MQRPGAALAETDRKDIEARNFREPEDGITRRQSNIRFLFAFKILLSEREFCQELAADCADCRLQGLLLQGLLKTNACDASGLGRKIKAEGKQ